MFKKLMFILSPIIIGVAIGVGILLVDPKAGQNVGDLLYSKSMSVESFSSAVARAAPSVVNIYVTTLNKDYSSPERDLSEITTSASGVIMSSDGYIVTNYHVVPSMTAPNQAVWAMTREGHLYQAFIVGYDRRTDIAVLKVEANGLPPIPMDNKYEAQVGDVVMAIGNPANLGQTVTHGIVSATSRSGSGLLTRNQMNIRDGLQDLIQTDAPINSGNSGGALINTAGNMVGVNTANINSSQTYGIGFAVPTKLVREVMDEIIKHGRVIRGYLGISDDGSVRMPDNLGGGVGVRVALVDSYGPAHNLLQAGDIIFEVNDHKLSNLKELIGIVSQSKPGSKLQFKVIRAAQIIEVTVTLTEDRAYVE
ncbi:MAG: trypsin-like peptidase domain-containing protein [Succinivibrio sp.]|nr:trypsin-like peptidase domain-containing protein [Succinivibrio sp.]